VNSGPLGALIGVIKEIKGPWLILHSNRALQKHDGLKFENGFGFAADEMRLASDPEGKRRFELPADAEIALKVPADFPMIGNGSPVYCSYSQAVRQRYEFSAPRPGQFRQRRPVNIHIFQCLEKMVLTASADVKTELTLSGPFEAAKNPEKAAATIRQCFEKLGDTDWKLDQLTIEGDPVFVPVSVLNDARRRLIMEFSELWENRQENPPRPAGTPPPEGILNSPLHGRGGRSDATDGVGRILWSVKSRVFLGLPALSSVEGENIDEFVLEIDPARPDEVEKALAFYDERLRLALPVIIRDEDAEIFKTLIEQFSEVWKWEAANIGGLNLLCGKKDVAADWPLYTMNTQAALQWRELGVQQFVLSPEDDAENMFSLIEQLGGAAIVPVYQHTPLMISATNPAATGTELTDRSRRAFRVEQTGHEFVLVNETPFSLTDHLDELKARGARRFRIDLSYGSDGADVVRRIISGSSVPGHTGNFDRGLI
jgi:putative protease